MHLNFFCLTSCKQLSEILTCYGIGVFCVSSDVNLLHCPQSHESYCYTETAKKSKLRWENFLLQRERWRFSWMKTKSVYASQESDSTLLFYRRLRSQDYECFQHVHIVMHFMDTVNLSGVRCQQIDCVLCHCRNLAVFFFFLSIIVTTVLITPTKTEAKGT